MEDSAPAAVFHLPKQIDPARMPRAFARSKSAHGFMSAWKKLREAMWTSRTVPYAKLPAFAAKWGLRLFETSERAAYDALLAGDVPFFMGWADRLLLIDQHAVELNLTIGERGTLLHAAGVLQGYADASKAQLKTLGGKWPQKAIP